MKLIPIDTNQNQPGVPNYYLVSTKWFHQYDKTGDSQALLNAQHYARIAEEFNQAFIVDDETQEITV